MRRGAVMLMPVVVLAAVALLLPARSQARAGFAPCHGTSGVQCGTVTVPLDRSGAVPGQVTLNVEFLPTTTFRRGTMLLLAGGPGQAGVSTFDLADGANYYRSFLPGYDLVTFDVRGTGKSGALNCPKLQSNPFTSLQEFAVLVGQCGQSLGPGRAFYGTRDLAEDIDAVRQALGVDRLAIWGTSYGTKLAAAYALAHPDHVERLLLDSTLPPEGPDLYGADVLRAIPSGLASLCSGGACNAAGANVPARVVTLANRLGAKPIRGSVLRPGGGHVTQVLDGERFVELVVDADLNPGVAAALPGAVTAALAGHPAAILRLARLDEASQLAPVADFSYGLFAATTCDDGSFPWGASTPLSQRQALLNAAVAALPSGTLGPFGSYATLTGTAEMCLDWPQTNPAPLGTGPLPNVPVLVLSGDRDTRTPTADGAQVAARFPQSHLLVVPGVGHSVLGADLTGCAQRAVVVWLAGSTPPARCPRSPLLLGPIPSVIPTVARTAPLGHVGGQRGRILGAVASTLREAEASWLLGFGGLGGTPQPVAAILGGSLTPSAQGSGFTLAGYSDVQGLRLSGQLQVVEPPSGPPLQLSGTVRVAGPKAAGGTLQLKAGAFSGTLGGKRVSGKV